MRNFPDNIAPGSPLSRAKDPKGQKAPKPDRSKPKAPQPSLDKRIKRQLRKPLVAGVALFVLMGGLIAGMDTWAWHNTQGLPRENVRVVAREDTGETRRCGRRSLIPKPIYVVTYESVNPPDGLPEVFDREESCSVLSPGDERVIVRSFVDAYTYRVWFNHPDTLFDALWPAALIGLGSGVFGGGVAYFAKRYSWERRGKHGQGPGKH